MSRNKSRSKKKSVLGPTKVMTLEEVGALLERTAACVEPEDQSQLESLVQSYLAVVRELGAERTTLARLRSMFGLRNNEKLANVVGETEEADGDHKPTADTEQQEAANLDEAEQGDEAEKGKGSGRGKGRGRQNGRNPASAFTGADQVRVPHIDPHLMVGARCPKCERGKLYQLDPSCIVHITGSALLTATVFACEKARCGTCGASFTAPAPQDVTTAERYTDSAVATIAVVHYAYGMPFHRLAVLQGCVGIPTPASTQWDYVNRGAQAMKPVHGALLGLATTAHTFYVDDTRAKVLEYSGKRRAKLEKLDEAGTDEPNNVRHLERPDRTGMYTTGIIAKTAEGPVAIFCNGRDHAGETLGWLLKMRDPTLATPLMMCDGLAHNTPTAKLGPDRKVKDIWGNPFECLELPAIIEANCMAHGRRKFVDVVESFPSECRYLLEQLSIIYLNDKCCRELRLGDQERLSYHRKNSGPVMGELKKRLEDDIEQKRVEPNSELGKVYAYMTGHWDRLTQFLKVAGAPLDNNTCERALKKAIMYRNNSLFYRSPRGAVVGGIYQSLIYTAELHGQNPIHYLTALLRHATVAAEDPAAWFPWLYKKTLARLEAGRDSTAVAA